MTMVMQAIQTAFNPSFFVVINPLIIKNWRTSRGHFGGLWREEVALKGVLYVKGGSRKVVFQGMHQMMGSDLAGLWGTEPKQTRMLFIGIDLPKDTLLTGLEGWLA
ncbi:GTP-binding protein [Polynucleobacter necessarius]|uniref:GTP-binding protein n=1 Tax=Polynucleobacter necessarius TaxID=576610 RepID=UPI0039E3E6AE